MNINFENTIIDTYIYYHFIDYLSIHDCINILLLNKYMYNNQYIKIHIKKLLSNRILNVFKYHINIMTIIKNEYIFNEYVNYNFHNNSKFRNKMMAYLYFKYYDRQYIYPYLKQSHGWKRDIIDKYNINNTFNINGPTRYDLFNVVKNIPANEVQEIGW